MTLTEHPVRLRIDSRISISQPADFILDAGHPVDPSRMFDPDVSPYCFDFDDRKLFCVATPAISGATFFYQAQRQHARSVIKVPFDALPEATASPTLMYSIGRCGSTLLNKAFEAAGVHAVSEPDFYTQAAYRQPADPWLREVLGRAAQLLPYSVVKLRADCCYAPLLIAGAFHAPRVMFVLRDPVDWAASLRRLSQNTVDPDATAAILRALLAALDPLTRHYAVRICYYEDFADLQEGYVNDLLAWMGSGARVSQAQLAEVAGKDAQEGTTYARDAVKNVPEDPAFREAFGLAWSKLRPVELIDRLQLRLI
ncbi:MAG: hypothetical protein GZ089_07045 [Aromatoleum sp.]|nr:hypothetical protein [Aromatoleum sp.]